MDKIMSSANRDSFTSVSNLHDLFPFLAKLLSRTSSISILVLYLITGGKLFISLMPILLAVGFS